MSTAEKEDDTPVEATPYFNFVAGYRLALLKQSEVESWVDRVMAGEFLIESIHMSTNLDSNELSAWFKVNFRYRKLSFLLASFPLPPLEDRIGLFIDRRDRTSATVRNIFGSGQRFVRDNERQHLQIVQDILEPKLQAQGAQRIALH